MTHPTAPRDLAEHDRAGIAGRLHTPDPAAVERKATRNRRWSLRCGPSPGPAAN